MEKGPDAFRTISEVAEDLGLPQHVLRFWETRFPQIRPLKRGGGRRYYRPDDVELLRGIRHLLYSEGYTIRGVQRILKEQGPRYVQMIWLEAEGEEPDGLADQVAAELVDAGHPGVPAARKAGRGSEGQHGGTLGGLLNLLPVLRGRDDAKGPVLPEELPDILDLPPRREPARGLVPEARREPHPAPLLRRDPPPAPRQEAWSNPTRSDMPSFPFRPAGPGSAKEAPRESAPPPEPRQPQAAPPPREPVQASQTAAGRFVPEAQFNLSRDDVRRLQATLYELQECRRILDAASGGKG
ncbi:MerR family transcriptional regulator [Bosea sp. 117]|uniref:MerR family transcriptional regulator n=1 Tax=Bosea sp. 117 TaxID=1125973 RepID=UPI0004947A83